MKTIIKNIIIILSIIIIATTNIYPQSSVDESLLNEIQQKIDVKYDPSFEIYIAYQIDSLELYESRYPTPYQITANAYGSLAHTIIFTAVRENEPCKGLVGIYKNGNIIWDSDTTINCEDNYGGFKNLVLFAVSEINNDDKIDLMFSSYRLGPTNYSAVQRLYIYSWDGSSGQLISETTNGGISTLKSFLSVGDFDIIDVDGNGIYEITGLWEDKDASIEQDEHRIFTYYWNGTKYVYDPSRWQPQKYDFFVQNNIDVEVKTSVVKSDSGFIYNYYVHNLSTSKQEIYAIYFDCGVDSAIENYPPNGWYSVSSSNLFGFMDLQPPTLYEKNNFIEIDSVEFFSFNSYGMPSLSKMLLQGYNRTPPLEDTVNGKFISFEDHNNNIITNSRQISTVAPSDTLYSIGKVEIIDSLLSYCNASYSIGWIKDEQTKDKYNTYFNTAKTYLEQGDSSKARAELQKVLTDCNTDSSTVLTSEAYALLYFNTEYLVNKLPEGTTFPPNDIEAKVKTKVKTKK